MKFKVGDKVRIRSYKSLAKEFGTWPSGAIKTKLTIYAGNMAECCGKVLTIKNIRTDYESGYIAFYFEEIPFIFSNDAIDLTYHKSTPKYFTGEVICIKNFSDFTKGKIYKINNGTLRDDVGYDFTEIKSVENLNDRLISKFLKIIR